MKRMLLLAAGILCAIRGAFAADSVFTKDGTHVYLTLIQEKSGLIDIDLQRKACRFVLLEQTVRDPVVSLTLSNTGNILFATKTAIWSLDPATTKCAKVCDGRGSKPEDTLQDIAYDPKSGGILATTANDEFYFPKNGNELKHIFNRRAPHIRFPVFAEDGTLFFAGYGDLWMGWIKPEPKDSELERYGSLFGFRCAPLAVLETADYNESSTGIHEIAVAKRAIYTRFSRMGGSGWGNFIRISRPAPIRDEHVAKGESAPSSPDSWSRAQAALASVEIFAECPSIAYLCASRDGRRVFFTNGESIGQSKVYLVEGNDKPRLVDIRGLAGLFEMR